MKILKPILLFCILASWGQLQAQDVHFSMFDMSPVNLNPAYTGFYEGTFRVGGIYRSQWQGLGTNSLLPQGATGNAYPTSFSGYKTPSAFIDAPIIGIKGKDKFGAPKHWFGAGINFYNDQVSYLSTLKAELALAFHAGLGARGNTRLSFGFKGGILQQSVGDASDYTFENDITGGTAETFSSGTASGMDFSAGLMLSHVAAGWNIEAGVAYNHLNSPELTITNDVYKLPSNIIGSVRSNISLTRKLSVRPMAFVQYMDKAFEANLQALAAIHFNDTKDFNLLAGAGYRLSDATFARLGLEYRGLSFGVAYDFNLSGLSNSNYTGSNLRGQGFELGLTYIAKIYRTPVVKEILFNPRF